MNEETVMAETNPLTEQETPKVEQPDSPGIPVRTEEKPKQYLLVVDSLAMVLLSKIMPGLLFVEVQGMAMKDNDTHMLLVNPKALPQASNEATKPLEESQQSC